MNLSELRKGDQVRVFEKNRRSPDGGFPGTVTGKGPKYLIATYRYEPDGHDRICKVRVSDGVSPEGYGFYTVQTPEVAERRLARSRDIGMLRKAGLTFTSTGWASLMDDDLLHQLAEMVEPYVLTTVAEANQRQGGRHD